MLTPDITPGKVAEEEVPHATRSRSAAYNAVAGLRTEGDRTRNLGLGLQRMTCPRIAAKPALLA